VEVLGFDPELGGRDFRERIGVVLQSCGIHRDLTVEEVISLFASYYPHPMPAGEVIRLVGLEEKRSARTKTLSGGQHRRLDLALGIVGDPDLVFLDEPTTGFDPSARRRAWELVANLRSLGKTIVLTTHYMDEAQQLADRVAVLAGGTVVASGEPASIGGRDLGEALVSFRLPADLAAADLPGELPGTVELRDGRASLRTTNPTRALHALTGWALARGQELDSLAVTRPSLEDVYLRLTTSEEDHQVGNGRVMPGADRG
jgi:ABC-2 type transport system ATP-binding protein